MNDYRITSEEILEWCNQYPYLNSGIHVKLFPKPTTHPTYGLEGIYFPSEVHSPLEAPVNHVPPHILGSGYPGDALIAFTGIWENTVSFLYQWRVDEISIPGAIEGTYTPTNYDIGHTISLVVTAFNITGTLTVIGDNTIQIIGTLVAGPPNNITPPSISGSPVAGQTLVATSGTWDTIGVLTGLWYSNGILIVREIMSYTFELTAVEEGTVITFVETNTTGGGNTSASSTATAVVTSPAEVMVRFGGATEWLTRDANFTGVVDGRFGICAFWIAFNGGDGATQTILRNAGGTFEIRKIASNVIRLIIKGAGGSPSFQVNTINTFVAGAGVYHVILAWNMNNTGEQAQCVVNGSDTGVTIADADGTAHDIAYVDTDWSIGGTSAGGSKLNADVGPFYLTLGETLNISTSAAIHRFFDSTGKPAYLGVDGSGPTGNPATLLMHGVAATYATNIGSGGGMTVHGALADTATDPAVVLAPLLADVYLDPITGSDVTGDGSAFAPWATPGKACLWADEGATIHLADGGVFRGGLILRRSANVVAWPGVGAKPILTGAQELKTAVWTDESSVGPNLWSTFITRDPATSTTEVAKVWLNDAPGHHKGMTAANLCVANGQYYHTPGAGSRKLYIYNSGGDPAADASLTSIEYQILRVGLSAVNLASVSVTGIQIDKFRVNTQSIGTDVGTFADLRIRGSTIDCNILRGPATSSTWTNVRLEENGVHKITGGQTEGAGHGFLLGGGTTGLVAPDTTTLDTVVIDTHDGEDCIQQAWGGTKHLELIDCTINCTWGENCLDLKSGSFHCDNTTFTASSIAGGGNECMAIHNQTTTFLCENSTLETVAINSACVTLGDGRVVTFRNNKFISGATGSPAGVTCLRFNFGAGDGCVIDGNLFIGPAAGTGVANTNATSCLRIDSGNGHTITNNTFVIRRNTAFGLHIRTVPSVQHTVSNNIFKSTGTVATDGFPVSTVALDGANLAAIFDYNHYYRSDDPARPVLYDWTNLVAYTPATIGTKDAHASTGDPLFASEVGLDFRLAELSPCLNTGDPAQDGKTYQGTAVVRTAGVRNKGSEVAA